MATVFLLIVNTCCGIYMFHRLTSCSDGACDEQDDAGLTHDATKRFVLKDEYVVHGIVLILVPASVFIFLLIVLIKLLCFILVDRKKARQQGVGGAVFGSTDKAYG